MSNSIIVGDYQYIGDLSVTGTFTGNVPLSSRTTNVLQVFEIPLTSWRTTAGAALGGVPANGSAFLGLSADTAGTGQMYLVSQDLDVANAATAPIVRTRFTLPWNYVAGSAITLRFNAGMKGEVSTISATIDAQVYLCSRANTVGSDLSTTTAATSINSVTLSDKDFVITPTGLVAGNVLEIQLVMALDPDVAAAASHYAIVPHTEILLSVK